MTITKEGSLASFYTVNKAPIKHLRVYFSPKQAGSGDPSPENVREISGWNEITLWQTGKNLFDYNNANIINRKNRQNDGSEKADGTGSYTGTFFPIIPSQNYIISQLYSTQSNAYYLSDINKNWISKSDHWNANTNIVQKTKTFTTTNNAYYFQLQSGDLTRVDWSPVQVELGSIATEYEPYRGQTYSLDWSNDIGTVYGGYVDLITGKLVQTQKSVTIGELSWRTVTNLGAGGWATSSLTPNDMSRTTTIISDSYKQTSAHGGWSQYQNEIDYSISRYSPSDNLCIVIKDSNYTSISDFISNQSDVKIIYDLATPITYQLTLTQLQTLIGQNNIWSNADRVEVEYDLAESNDELYRRRNIILGGYPHIETISGNVTNFQTDMVAPLKEAKVYFNPVQEGEGDPSPENIRPISGWTGFNILQTNKNLYGGLALANYFAVKGATLDTNAKTISYSGSTANSIGTLLDKFDSGQYTIIAKFTSTNNNQNLNIRVYYTDGGELLLSSSNAVDTSNDTYKFLTNASKTISKIACSWIAGTCTLYYENFGIFKGNVDISQFVPCTNNMLNIDWEDDYGTIYGGYVNLTTGQIYKDWEKVMLTEYMTSWNSWGGNILLYNNYYMANGSNVYHHGLRKAGTIIYSNILTPIGGNIDPQKVRNKTEIRYYGVDSRYPQYFFMAKNADETVADWRTWFVNNYSDAYIVYNLATPKLVGQLTPTQLKALKGTNNIWSNANGPIEVKYWTH